MPRPDETTASSGFADAHCSRLRLSATVCQGSVLLLHSGQEWTILSAPVILRDTIMIVRIGKKKRKKGIKGWVAGGKENLDLVGNFISGAMK